MRRPPAPWLTDGIRKLMARRNHLYRKHRNYPTEESFLRYKRARNKCNQEIRNAKRRDIYGMIEKCTPNNIWKVLNDLGFGRSRSAGIPTVDANALNKHFTTVTYKVNDIDKSETIKQLAMQPLGNFTGFSFSEVDSCDVQKIITGISSKAVGHDGIGSKVLSPILEHILPCITHIINFSLNSNIFPSLWKKAYVIPIPKKPTICELKDYRPISILPFLSKVLEKVVNHQLSSFLQTNNLLDHFQSGFRPAHSTSTALIKITDDIRLAIDNRKLTLLCLLDFSNAFNCVDHDIMLAVLRSVNLSQSTISWFSSYLRGRQQCVRIDNVSSDWSDITVGVPQGGVLSPLLFSLFINTLVAVIRYTSHHLYADDVQLYLSVNPDQLLHGIHSLTKDLSAVYDWTQKYGLLINPNKTQVIIIGGNTLVNRVDASMLPPVKYNGIALQYCKQVKNLGLYISDNLSWDFHITQISKRMYGTMHSLKRMKNFLPQSTRITLVTALLLPILDYADVCYPDVTEEQLNRLQRLQNLCIRYIYGLRKFDHVSMFRRQLKWLDIRARRDEHILSLLFNILHNPMSPNYLSERFMPLYADVQSVRSCQRLQLMTPQHKTTTYTNSFTITATRLWNHTPLIHREASSVEAFRARIHNHLFGDPNE